MKRFFLITIFLLFGVALLIPSVNAATSNHYQPENFPNTTETVELTSNSQSTETIQATTTSSSQVVDEVKVTESNSKTSSDSSYSSKNIQNAKAAAGASKTTTTYTIADIGNAAGTVKTYIETNKKLPSYVTMGTKQVTMAQFLSLLTNAVLQVNSGTTTPIALKTFGTLTNLKENINTGNMYQEEYLYYAQQIKDYMDSSGLAPEYIYDTSLGTYMRYESLIYMYSNIMNSYKTNGNLPTYVAVIPWAAVTSTENPPSGMDYLQPTANCESDNAGIIALANSITAGQTSAYDKATSIFNWVRDHITYSFYYNTKYGAVGTLNSGTGNCCDTTHLLVALSRAAGLPARYVHGACTFSSGKYGHVFAQIYVNGAWYYADAISSSNYFGVINNWDTSSWRLKGIYTELPF